ncbi:hypothetical protein KP509_36G011700 [Ceratopteris richardii]|uniref:SHSP domain-containing protein n=1 Tax=Ceratopteris richardii TaxID=49495 RepID=A0A8T2QAR2_CERRI|nr:hypothetical protein KP509_36G011700 [Ceratopteris richardii]
MARNGSICLLLARTTHIVLSSISCGQVDADWTEDCDSHFFIFDVPGLTVKDVTLDIIDDIHLQISGEFPPERNFPGKWHTKERRTGAFRRTFQLPQDVLTSQIRAFDVEAGVLVVKVPKRKAFVRTIPIA